MFKRLFKEPIQRLAHEKFTTKIIADIHDRFHPRHIEIFSENGQGKGVKGTDVGAVNLSNLFPQEGIVSLVKGAGDSLRDLLPHL